MILFLVNCVHNFNLERLIYFKLNKSKPQRNLRKIISPLIFFASVYRSKGSVIHPCNVAWRAEPPLTNALDDFWVDLRRRSLAGTLRSWHLRWPCAINYKSVCGQLGWWGVYPVNPNWTWPWGKPCWISFCQPASQRLCGSSGPETERSGSSLLWGYLLLMTRKLHPHTRRMRHVCGLLKCFQISRISSQRQSALGPMVCWLLDAVCLSAQFCFPVFYFLFFMLFFFCPYLSHVLFGFSSWHRRRQAAT